MVVAPLMQPIRAFGYALLCFEGGLLRTFFLTLVASVVTVVLIGIVVGYLSFRPEFGSEILSRTSVTFLGLGVAIAGGVLAALSRTERNSKITDSLVGVGISVSLVPPLCAAGITLSQGDWYDSAGAFMIFLTNFVGISLACAIVFFVRRYASPERWRAVAGFGTFAVLIALLSPALAQAGYRARQLSGAEDFLARRAAQYFPPVLSVESTAITWKGKPYEIVTMMRAARPPSKIEVRRLNDAMNERLGDRYHLTVVQDPAASIAP
jgi:uncharacterized hydrophobic protein (TIGR00271 family)